MISKVRYQRSPNTTDGFLETSLSRSIIRLTEERAALGSLLFNCIANENLMYELQAASARGLSLPFRVFLCSYGSWICNGAAVIVIYHHFSVTRNKMWSKFRYYYFPSFHINGTVNTNIPVKSFLNISFPSLIFLWSSPGRSHAEIHLFITKSFSFPLTWIRLHTYFQIHKAHWTRHNLRNIHRALQKKTNSTLKNLALYWNRTLVAESIQLKC